MQKLRFLTPALMLCAASALAQTSKPVPREVTASATSDPKATAAPNYQDTVDYIKDKVQQAGVPGSTSSGKITLVVDDTKFSVSFQSCESMTITRTNTSHLDDRDNVEPHQDNLESTVTTIPFSSVAVGPIIGDSSIISAPAVFSTHALTQDWTGRWWADGFRIGGGPQGQPPAGPLVDVLEGFKQLLGGDWHDGVWIIMKDSGLSWKTTSNSSGPASGYADPNVPIPILPFKLSGTGATSAHVAKAIQHLVDICVNHPGQAPKEMF